MLKKVKNFVSKIVKPVAALPEQIANLLRRPKGYSQTPRLPQNLVHRVKYKPKPPQK